jgi:hypothetical protein
MLKTGFHPKWARPAEDRAGCAGPPDTISRHSPDYGTPSGQRSGDGHAATLPDSERDGRASEPWTRKDALRAPFAGGTVRIYAVTMQSTGQTEMHCCES